MPIGRMTPGQSISTIAPSRSVAQAATGGIGRMSGAGINTSGIGRMAAPQPAINPSIGGFFKNLVGGIGDMVKGLGTLFIQAPIHDVAQLGASLVPGTQAIENEPSQLATVARTALPGAWFPGPDLGGKYGSIASDYQHRYGGASNIVRGLYEEPMSFILDALVFADGVGAVAKAGRVGTLAKYAPRLVSDAAAEKILGPALIRSTESATGFVMPNRYGALGISSLERAGGNVEDLLKLSKNPLVRTAQRGTYKYLSRTPEATEALAAETPRAAEVIQAATDYGRVAGRRFQTDAGIGTEISGRILKPKVGEFLAKHEQNKILSALRVRTQDKGAAAINSLNQVVDGIEEGAPAEARATLRVEAADVDRGVRQPAVLPRTDAIDIPETQAIVTKLDDMPQIGKTADDPAAAVKFAREYGQEGDNFAASVTPVAEAGGGQGALSFKLPVESLDDAPRVGPEALAKMGYTDDLRVLDTLADPHHPWDGKHYVARNPETGLYAHVTVGTKELLGAQEAGDFLIEAIQDLGKKRTRVADEASKIPDGDPRHIALAAEELSLSRKIRAAREVLRDDIFKDVRATYWEGKGYEYDLATKMSLRTRPLRYRELVRRAFKEKLLDPETLMERKYSIVRMSRLLRFLSDMRPGMEQALLRYSPGAEGQVYLALHNILAMKGVPTNLIETVLGKEPWLKSVDDLVSSARHTLWDYTVKEGGGGLMFDAAPFDWTVMSDEFQAHNLISPGYTPELPAQTPSQMALKHPVNPVQPRPAFAKDINGLLFEEGRLEPSLPDTIARANRITITHEEAKGVFVHADEQFGRDATLREMEAANAGDARFTGEVYYNPQQIASDIDMRGELLANTILGIPEAGDVGQAVVRSFKDWGTRAFEQAVNNMNGPLRSMPRRVAEQLSEELSKTLRSQVSLFWDTPAKVWKASVLSLSPRWVLNNLFGNNIFVGLEDPMAFKQIIHQFDKRDRALAQYMFGTDLIREVESGFFHATADDVRAALLRSEYAKSTGSKMDLTREILMGDKESEQLLARMNAPSRAVQSWSKGVRNVNSYVEESYRRGLLINELSRSRVKGFLQQLESTTKMYQRFADEGFPTAAETARALERVDRIIGNFTRYSPIEQGVIRRFFMPFYGFYRHMTNVLAKMPFEHPLKSTIFTQIANMDEIMNTGVPSYLQGENAIHIGMFGGDAWTKLKNLNPLSPFTDEYSAIGLLDPRLKLLIERSLGISTFTGEPWDLGDLGLEGEMVKTHDGQYWKVLRDGDGNVLGVTPTSRPNPDLVKHVVSQFGMTSLIPQLRMYPRSFEQNLASWVGTPVTRPKAGTPAALQYDSEVQAEALAQASGGASAEGFGSFGSFGSF